MMATSRRLLLAALLTVAIPVTAAAAPPTEVLPIVEVLSGCKTWSGTSYASGQCTGGSGVYRIKVACINNAEATWNSYGAIVNPPWVSTAVCSGSTGARRTGHWLLKWG